ncbi:MAG: hypothetical protein IJZ00_04625 [Lachnospiraceae bacterium]|nr:hypothetical protein [Lachnospiraceae bacterium]
MIEFIKENIISITALGVSLISLFFTVRKELKSIIRISIKPCQGECVYFTRVDSLICYGIIVCRVKITNKSNTACGINDIYLKLSDNQYIHVIYKRPQNPSNYTVTLEAAMLAQGVV